MGAMQIATGTVVDGKIVLEGVPLMEGARVTVVTRGADEGFSLSEAQENELLVTSSTTAPMPRTSRCWRSGTQVVVASPSNHSLDQTVSRWSDRSTLCACRPDQDADLTA